MTTAFKVRVEEVPASCAYLEANINQMSLLGILLPPSLEASSHGGTLDGVLSKVEAM